MSFALFAIFSSILLGILDTALKNVPESDLVEIFLISLNSFKTLSNVLPKTKGNF